MKIQEAKSNNVEIAEKKEKQYVTQIIYTNRGYLPTTVTPDSDFTDKPVFQYVLIAGNTFIDVDDCK